jgi:hypothetical protein
MNKHELFARRIRRFRIHSAFSCFPAQSVEKNSAKHFFIQRLEFHRVAHSDVLRLCKQHHVFCRTGSGMGFDFSRISFQKDSSSHQAQAQEKTVNKYNLCIASGKVFFTIRHFFIYADLFLFIIL